MQGNQYDAIIIGAGSGGLSSGLKLASCGKKVLILEKQAVCGGFATLFRRKGFTFESSVHCVDDLTESGEIRKFLNRCGIDSQIEFSPLKDFARLINPEHDFIADFKRDSFVNYLKANFPHEENNIERLFGRIDKFYREFRKFNKLSLPFWMKLAATPLFFPEIIKTSSVTAKDFILRYTRDEKLAGLVTNIWGFMGLPPEKLSAFYFLVVFTGYFYQPTGYVRGGISRIFEAIMHKITEKGGDIKLNTRVTGIITDRGKAKGVLTEKGEEFRAKVIISGVNAIDTLCKFPDREDIRDFYIKKLTPMEKSISASQVYLGLGITPKQLGMDHFMFFLSPGYDHGLSYDCSLRGDYEGCFLSVVDHSQLEPGFAPKGKGTLMIFVLDNYANWSGLDDSRYKAKKIEVANKLIARVEKYLPGLTRNIEVMEIATPRTMERFGAVPEGAIYGFSQTLPQSSIMRLPQETKIKGLFLAGAWTRPGGGVHACFVSGMDAAELALKVLR